MNCFPCFQSQKSKKANKNYVERSLPPRDECKEPGMPLYSISMTNVHVLTKILEIMSFQTIHLVRSLERKYITRRLSA